MNYLDFARATYQAGRDAAIQVLQESKTVKFKPTRCESGYFMAVDISGNEEFVPKKYFEPNINYEP